MALRPRTPPRGQGSLARSPMPIVRPAGCALSSPALTRMVCEGMFGCVVSMIKTPKILRIRSGTSHNPRKIPSLLSKRHSSKLCLFPHIDYKVVVKACVGCVVPDGTRCAGPVGERGEGESARKERRSWRQEVSKKS